MLSAVVRSASGPDAASLAPAITQFRKDLGGFNNDEGGNPASGRREINWDAVPAASAAPNALPGNFFNSTSARGAVLSSPTAGTTFQVSGAAADNGTGQPAAANFGNLNATYATTFKPFSSPRLFSPVGGNVTDVTFFVPNAATTAATVRGFGAVFSDVDDPAATTIEFFDAAGASLGKFSAPAADGGLSFLGVSFNAGERAAKVRITTGNTPVGPADGGAIAGGVADVVVMDDFIYSEPVAQGLYRWDGIGDTGALGGNDLWSNPLNWFGDAVPPPGSALEFPDGVTYTTNTNDLPAGTAFSSIAITGSGYEIDGNAITLSDGMSFVAAATVPEARFGPALILTGNETFTVASATNPLDSGDDDELSPAMLTLSGQISGPGGLTKDGPDVLQLRGLADNTYAGDTTVVDGRLELADARGIAVPGALTVGGDDGGAGDESVVLLAPSQLAPAAAVDVFPSGTLDLNGFSQAVGSLRLRSGTSGGGSVTTVPGTSGMLTLGGDVTVAADGTGAVGASIAGRVNLGGATRTFTVADGAAAVDLDLSAAVVGTGNPAGVTKAGPGTLRFSGAASNTYAGTTTVAEGTLEAGKNGGPDAPAPTTVPGPLVIGGAPGAPAAVFREVVSNQLPDLTPVTVNASGVFQVASFRQDVVGPVAVVGGTIDVGSAAFASLTAAALDMTGGRVKIGPSGSGFTVNGGVAARSDAAGAAAITSAGGRFTLGSAGGPVRTFTVARGPAAVDLDVQAPVAAAAGIGLVKNGAGVMRLGGNNTYAGTTEVDEGALLVDGKVGPVSVVGGVLGGSGTAGTVAATGGAVAPGDGPGVLHAAGVSLGPAAAFNVEVNGAAAAPYDQLDVTGPVGLGGAALNVSAAALPAVADGDVFTIVNNDGSDPVAGTFAGLPEGAILLAGGAEGSRRAFRISYRGGDGNDVVLTPAGAVSVGDVSQAETDRGQTAFVFTVTRSGGLSDTASVDYVTRQGTATAGVDYQSAAGTVTFLPGQSVKSVVVFVNGDATFEPDETFSVDLAAPFNLAIDRGRGTGTILNDDRPPPPSPRLSVEDVSAAEGDGGYKSFNFQVTLDKPSAVPVTVHFATADGTARVSDQDYVAKSGTITFAPGQTRKVVSVPVRGDKKSEPDETFLVRLASPLHATIARGVGTGTIRNDDPPARRKAGAMRSPVASPLASPLASPTASPKASPAEGRGLPGNEEGRHARTHRPRRV